MCRPLKLIQITDMHLRGEADAIVHGWHVNRAWRRIRDDAIQRHADAALWVLTGDLVEDESVRGYARLDADLAALPAPILALAGNHDDPAAMQKHLRHARVHADYHLGGWHLYALNSHVAGTDGGCLDTGQLEWLQQALTRRPEPSVLFLHHPPVALASRWLDAISLQNGAAFRQLVQSQPQIAAVICGHAHQAFATHIGSAHCWGTPATMRQFKPRATEFALDTVAPGYRVIHLYPNGRIRSHVQRLTPACE
ncbi:MAG TPA: metallophosphoesterase [Salinisphaeraceae bacterium]|nr:metallophosphoesterase [Salinisphaeraceae bacterium]